MKRAIQMRLEGYEVIEKVVEKGGNSGRVYVPKKWLGKKVRVISIEP